ncbi:MAG TPA: ATP-binding protein, partial [Steroidobacteraceae bacterium]
LHAAVLASLHDQIAILDSTGRIVEINESWRRAVESAPGPRFDRALPGVNLVDACARAAERGDRAAAEQLDALRAVLGGTEVRRQFECAGPEGDSPTWIEVSVEKLRRGEGGVVVTRTDVTARKQAELEARNQRLQLTHLGRAAILGQLSGAFAHELKQPLTSILGNAEAALRMLARGSNDPAELREILIDIVQDDERAAQVIQRLRSLLDKGDTVRQPVDLNQVIQEVLELARSELITRNVSVTTDFDRSAPIVQADRVQMQQVILNLLMNACEAMTNVPAAQRKIMVRTRYDRTGSFVEASVTDTGCGIPPADLERIFQPFVTTKGQGMGLGLAICRSVAQAHGGRLWAESTPGAGATFHLRIPTEGEIS